MVSSLLALNFCFRFSDGLAPSVRAIPPGRLTSTGLPASARFFCFASLFPVQFSKTSLAFSAPPRFQVPLSATAFTYYQMLLPLSTLFFNFFSFALTILFLKLYNSLKAASETYGLKDRSPRTRGSTKSSRMQTTTARIKLFTGKENSSFSPFRMLSLII